MAIQNNFQIANKDQQAPRSRSGRPGVVDGTQTVESRTTTGLQEGPVGVVLFQLGGPDSLDSVEPFLYNLFSDPDIIEFPFARLARPVLAKLISSRRAKKAQAHYASIGGKSPIGELTQMQASALERQLRRTVDARVFVAMRYWHPLTEEVVLKLTAHAFNQVILLPLYPQYSRTTTGSSLNEWKRKYRRLNGDRPRVTVINSFHDHPLYLQSVVERINEGLQKFASESAAADDGGGSEVNGPGPSGQIHDSETGPPDVHLVFSAHGVPASVIEQGDPYQAQVEATVRLVLERGAWSNPHCLCYQSRVGPGRWLHPSLDETLHDLASQRARRVLVIPIAFVSEHVETLSEIDIEARELSEHLGIAQFEMMPALNGSPTFIAALAELVLREVRASKT